MTTPSGKLMQNGKFYEAAKNHENGKPELIKVYEKIKDGIWIYNGIFELLDSWLEKSGGRKVFKFKLNITDVAVISPEKEIKNLEHNRIIPTSGNDTE
jgi:hypothetical protein